MRSYQNLTPNIVNNFRLSLTSGTPVTTSDVTNATTIYCTPYNGNLISLYNGSVWSIHSSNEFSLALGTLTNSTPYDVFCYSNSGVPTLEFLAWTNTTTRATNLTYQNGILVKSGDATRRYLGSFYNPGNNGGATVTMTIAGPCVVTYNGSNLAANTPVVFTTTGALPTGITANTTYYVASTGTSTANTFNISATPGGATITTSGSQSGTHTLTIPTYTEDSVLNRYLFNYYNAVPRTMVRVESATSWNYTTAVTRQSNANILNQLNFFIGISESPSAFRFRNGMTNTTAGVNMASLIGLDSTTAGVDIYGATTAFYQPVATATVPLSYAYCEYTDFIPIGKHYVSMLENSVATGTTTWFGTKSALRGVIIM